MTTTTTSPALPAQRTACPVCGKTHRPGSKAAATCAALAPSTATAPAALTVTREHLRAVLAGWDSALVRVDVAGAPLLFVAPAWSAGDVIVDRHDVATLRAHLGSLEAVAADLTAALRWEQAHGGVA